MKYNLPGFPEEEFDRADALVRATILAQGRVETWNTTRRVTSDLNDLSKYYRDKVARSLSVEGNLLRGAASPSPNNDMEFDIWFNPFVVDESARFRATVLHELCHGYIGVPAGHNHRWRNLYARVLFHYHHEVHTIDHYLALVDVANWSYTKRGKTESLKNFLARIGAERERSIAQADREADRVQSLWKTMATGQRSPRI